MMRAKPDLRLVLKWMIAGSGSVIADVIPLGTFRSMADSKISSPILTTRQWIAVTASNSRHRIPNKTILVANPVDSNHLNRFNIRFALLYNSTFAFRFHHRLKSGSNRGQEKNNLEEGFQKESC